jgi:type VI secretion system secreted protein VgrG
MAGPNYHQDTRTARVKVGTFATTELVLAAIDAYEHMNEMFDIQVEVVSAIGVVDFAPHLGEPVSLSLQDAQGVKKPFHGILVEANLLQESNEGARFSLRLAPWTALIDQGRNYRVYQNKTSIEIIQELLTELGCSDVKISTPDGLRRREYTVQYRESDYNFIARLLEDDGIASFYDHTADKHIWNIGVARSICRPNKGYETIDFFPTGAERMRERDHLSSWSEAVAVAPRIATLKSYDFKKPSAALLAESSSKSAHPADDDERFDHAGTTYLTQVEGQKLADRRMESQRWRQQVFSGAGTAVGLDAGGTFKLKGHPLGRYNNEYLIIACRHRITFETYRTGAGASGAPARITLTAIRASVPWAPVRARLKPVVQGPHTAVVVGTEDEKDILVDEYGRVRVQFRWDRANPNNEKSSCWIRVSQAWAGDTWGWITVPRVGQEVLVDYIEGDPDQPIITGRVYNGEKMPPYALPANRTRATWKSRSVYMKGDGGGWDNTEDQPSGPIGYNELRFEDRGGKEEVWLHAQRDMNTRVRRDETWRVGREQKIRVGYDRLTEIKRHDTYLNETGNETHTVRSGDRTTKINKNDTLTVEKGDLKTVVEMGNIETTANMGNITTTAKLGNITIEANAGSITLKAMQKIEFIVGMTKVTVDQTGISGQGMMFKISATAMAEVTAAMTTIQGSAMTTVKGAMVMIN